MVARKRFINNEQQQLVVESLANQKKIAFWALVFCFAESYTNDDEEEKKKGTLG